MAMSPEIETYRQLEAETALPVEAVILHCDTLARELKQAAAGIRAGNIEERVRHSNHGLLVLQALELMLDFANGGDTAKELAKVYSYLRAKVLEAQIKLDAEMLERQSALVLQLREAWNPALTSTANGAAPAKSTTANLGLTADFSRPYAAINEEAPRSSWSA